MAGVFISYSSHDRTAAFAIKQLLEQHGCEVWLGFFTPARGITARPKRCEAKRGHGGNQ
jgi:hypothetical protein